MSTDIHVTLGSNNPIINVRLQGTAANTSGGGSGTTSDVIVRSQNLLNYASKTKIPGKYVHAANGVVQPASGYTAWIVPITGGSVLSFNASFGAAHVAFFRQSITTAQIRDAAAGTNLPGFISGFADQIKQGYTAPADAVCLVASIADANAPTAQIEVGAASTAYQPYQGIWSDNVLGHRVLSVGPGRQFTSIQAAVNAASDGDTIQVYNGTYNEAVNVRFKSLRIVGQDRALTVLRYSCDDYQHPPLQISQGVVENMTIYAYKPASYTPGINRAYAVHVDYTDSADRTLAFRGVDFVSEDYQTVGVGLQHDFALSFEHCHFKAANRNALYIHDSSAAAVATNQRLIMENCLLENNGTEYTMLMQSQEITGNVATATFRGVALINRGTAANQLRMVAYQTTLSGSNFLGSKDWILDSASGLNNVAAMNASGDTPSKQGPPGPTGPAGRDGAGSGENFLINPWFQINQRGVGSATTGYIRDCWRVGTQSGGSGVYTWEADNGYPGLGIGSTTSTGYTELYQRIPMSVAKSLYNRTITASFKVQGKIVSATAVFNSESTGYITPTTSGAQQVLIYVSKGAFLSIVLRQAAGTSIGVYAAKLEVGDTSTLGVETPPAPAIELLRCQRYFVRLRGYPCGWGFITSSTGTPAQAFIPLPVPMHKTPTLGIPVDANGHQTMYVLAPNENKYTTSVTVDKVEPNGLQVTAKVPTAFTVTPWTSCVLYISPGSYLDITADVP